MTLCFDLSDALMNPSIMTLCYPNVMTINYDLMLP